MKSLLIPYLERARYETIVGPISTSEIQRLQPKNPEVEGWYASLSPEDQELFSDMKDGKVTSRIHTLDLVTVTKEAVRSLSGMKVTGSYERKFRRGEGEAIHTDPHDIVITQTTGAGAGFTIWNDKVPTPVDLSDGDILVFRGTLPHQVGPANNHLRVVRAVGIDFIS